MTYEPHIFAPSQTIAAVIRWKNRHDASLEELRELLEEFVRVNGSENPVIGKTYLIPIAAPSYMALDGR